jgi:hypothetical protein
MLGVMEPLLQLLAVVLTALALIPAAAHVLELPNKLPLQREEYLTVQQVYRGWNRIGFIVLPAIAVTMWLAIISEGPAEAPAVVAFVAILFTQVVFWGYTFPINRLTHDWTEAPDNWEQLRDRWEISHAASAVLNFIALVCVAVSIALA